MPWDRPPGRRASESRCGPAPWEVCAPQLPGPRILDKRPVGQSISAVATQVAGAMLAVILMRQGQRTLLTGKPGFWPPSQLHPGHSSTGVLDYTGAIMPAGPSSRRPCPGSCPGTAVPGTQGTLVPSPKSLPFPPWDLQLSPGSGLA